MKKIIFILSTGMLFNLSVMAKDACTPHVDGYLIGLDTGATLVAQNEKERQKTLEQIANIKKMRETLQDCKIVDFIPKLKASKDALEFANKQIKKID